MSADILAILRQARPFRDFDNKTLTEMGEALQEERFPKGSILFKEGDPGDSFFIICDGAIRIFTQDRNAQEIVLARLDAGDFFGEQAVVSSQILRQSASALALTDTTCLTLRHEIFKQHLQINPRLQGLLEEYGANQLVKKLAKQLERHGISDELFKGLFSGIQHVQKRQVLFRQGDPAADVYFILNGSVQIRFYNSDMELISRTNLGTGQFFGELSILRNAPRSGTAVATSDSNICVLNGAEFQKAYKETPYLHKLIDAMIGTYQVPRVGLVTQYRGFFLGLPAIQTVIQKREGEIVHASRVVNAEIFAIEYPNVKHTRKIQFEDTCTPQLVRELRLAGDHVTSVISIGAWEDLDVTCQHVLHKTRLGDEDLRIFAEFGRLPAINDAQIDEEQELCHCAQIKTRLIQNLIQSGIVNLEDIKRRSGAGNVCGSCRPRIIELLGGQAWNYARIVAILPHNPAIRSFRFQLVDRPFHKFSPGQHIVIEGQIDNRWVTRSYTLTSTGEDVNYYEITVKREPRGLFSRWLFDQAKVGDLVRLSKPSGDLSFQLSATTPAVCLVGGIGITPAIAFARTLTGGGYSRTLYIDYSVRFKEVAFGEELAAWAVKYSNIATRIRYSDVDGRLTDQDLFSTIARYADAEFYLCGPPTYEDTVLYMLKRVGISTEHIHIERFIHAGGPSV